MKYPFLERRVDFLKIFYKDSKIPETKEECLSFFKKLVVELSPENLSADGERSHHEIRQRRSEIDCTWKELESIYGKEISIDEVESLLLSDIRLKKN